jgi:hypothetical protein
MTNGWYFNFGTMEFWKANLHILQGEHLDTPGHVDAFWTEKHRRRNGSHNILSQEDGNICCNPATD